MKNDGEIRWLQLSDLHMFDSTEMKRQKKSLYEQFNSKTDFLVITGDLHQYGTNYSLTIEFLEETVTEMGIEKEDVYIVPGNHDVRDFKGRTDILMEIDKQIENNPDAYMKDKKKLYLAFAQYKKFIQNFYGNKAQERDFLENALLSWHDKIGILCINTALVSDGEHFKPQVIDIYNLQEIQNRKFPCFAIMHHDYYSIAASQLPFIAAKFRELGVSATLSGHKHRYSRNVIDLGNGETIPNYCCGKSVSEPGDLWSDVGIIEYRWVLSENIVRIIPYQWDSYNLCFAPVTKFEYQNNRVVDDSGCIVFNQNFKLRKSDAESKIVTENKKNYIDKKGGKDRMTDFSKFREDIQSQYLDGILKFIGEDTNKFKQAIQIMERIISYDGQNIKFDQIIDMIVSCKNKNVLSINGLQGTGKSTFLSLIYYELDKKFEETKIFPILFDLHALDDYSKTKAKKILQEHLNAVDDLKEKNQNIKFLLMFDGVDDYIRKTSDLENDVYKYVEKNEMGNFAFCIGSADYLPNDMCKRSPLQGFSNAASYQLEAHGIEKRDEDSLLTIINSLLAIYSFNVKKEEISVIKKAICVYTINKIDYRTLLIILRVFGVNKKKKNEYELGSYFYEYYLQEMNNSEDELYKHAEAAYQYIILQNKDALRNLKHSKIIYNNGITIDFLLAYYFVNLIKRVESEAEKVLNGDFVFTASVNKFIKDLLLNKYSGEQTDIANKMIASYNISDISMKSQICYILGRVQQNKAKTQAKAFLKQEWDRIYSALFENDILVSQKQDIKSELVLFRTISVSLIWLGYDNNQENFLRCLLLNEKLNQINRGFHLEYYEDKAYMNGVSPTYVDNENISVDKTMNYLIGNINKGFSESKDFNRSIYLDIITLFSIYQYRSENIEIVEKYQKILLEIAEKVLQSPKIQSKTIMNYVTAVKELLVDNPYHSFIQELYQVKSVKREGWIRRGVELPESIADHMYGCYMLGMFFLPNNIYQCIDYNIPDIKEYAEYSKEKILQMLLLHDFAEAKIGDIVTYEKDGVDIRNENLRFDYYEFLCSFPKIYGLGIRKKAWDEFVGNTTINARIANDIDKIEPIIQAYIYKENNSGIDLDEWKKYARQNVNTSLGKKFLEFVIEKLIK